MRREKMVRALVAMAAVDKVVDPSELRLLERLCAEWNVAPRILWLALAEVRDKRPRSIDVPKDPSQRRLLLMTLVGVAAADGVIARAERRMLNAVALKVGVSAAQLEALIDEALQAARASA